MSSSKSRKKDTIIVALGDSHEKWNGYLLKTYGLPQEPQARNEVSESAFVNQSGVRSPLEDVAAHQIRIGEEPPRGLSKVWAELSLPESQPSEQWKRSQAFVRVFTTILIEGTTTGLRTPLGFGSGSTMASVADLSLRQSGWGKLRPNPPHESP